MYDLLTVGELLLRYSPQQSARLMNASGFDCYVGGAELNVAAGVAQLGGHVGMISKIPAHGIGELARKKTLSLHVSDEYLLADHRREARLGAYFFEKGAYPRKPEVIYDRLNSSFQSFSVDELPESVFENARWFHTSGINLALGGAAREVTIALIKKFHEHGAKVSFDVNFRGNLWSGAEAKACIEPLLPYVDVFFCSEDTARLTFLKEGNLQEIMRSFADEYPNLSYVCASRRTVHSASCHSFTSTIYDAKEDVFYADALPYASIEVVDRIGSGDAFVAGCLYGLINGLPISEVAAYGDALGAMKNTVSGDIAEFTKAEIDALILGHRTQDRSEMKR